MKFLTTFKPCVLSHKEQMYMYTCEVVDYLLALCVAPQRTFVPLPSVDYVYACALAHKKDVYIYEYGTQALGSDQTCKNLQLRRT